MNNMFEINHNDEQAYDLNNFNDNNNSNTPNRNSLHVHNQQVRTRTEMLFSQWNGFIFDIFKESVFNFFIFIFSCIEHIEAIDYGRADHSYCIRVPRFFLILQGAVLMWFKHSLI